MQHNDIRQLHHFLDSIDQRLKVAAVAVVCLITFFVNNNVITPDIMECRNIVTAREMVYDGHWIVTTMNGELRFEKPPLPTWLTAVAEIVAAGSLSMQRSMAGLVAVLLVVYFWKFARRVLGVDPLIPTLILLTCYNVILMGRTASWDIYTHAFMMGAIYHLALSLGRKEGKTTVGQVPQWRHFMLSGLMIGLSIMSKGPVSLYALFLPFVIAYVMLERPSIKGKWPQLTVMAIIAVVIGSWWYVYIYAFHGDELSTVVGKETGSWLNHNVRPWWYYWKFFLEAGVWSLLLLTAIVLPITSRNRRKNKQWLLPVAWMAGSLILLSLLPEKKSRYLLPLIIPACYVMGVVVEWWTVRFKGIPSQIQRRSADARLMRINAVLIAIAVAILPVVAWFYLVKAGSMPIAQWYFVLAVCVATAVYIDMAALQLKPMRMVGGVVLLFLITEALFLPSLTAVINNPDMRSVSELRLTKETASLPLYYDSKEKLRIETVYAAGKCIKPIDVSNVNAIVAGIPCVLLTQTPLTKLPDGLMQVADTIHIGRFDDNRWAEGHSLYHETLINYATIVKNKLSNNNIIIEKFNEEKANE